MEPRRKCEGGPSPPRLADGRPRRCIPKHDGRYLFTGAPNVRPAIGARKRRGREGARRPGPGST
jgi:hypothetical protein